MDAGTTAKIANDALHLKIAAEIDYVISLQLQKYKLKLADKSIFSSKLEHGSYHSNDGKFLRARTLNGQNPTFETVTGINNKQQRR